MIGFVGSMACCETQSSACLLNPTMCQLKTNGQSGGQSRPARTPAALWKAIAPAPGQPGSKTIKK